MFYLIFHIILYSKIYLDAMGNQSDKNRLRITHSSNKIFNLLFCGAGMIHFVGIQSVLSSPGRMTRIPLRSENRNQPVHPSPFCCCVCVQTDSCKSFAYTENVGRNKNRHWWCSLECRPIYKAAHCDLSRTKGVIIIISLEVSFLLRSYNTLVHKWKRIICGWRHSDEC